MGIRTSARIGACACLGVALGLAALGLRGAARPNIVDPAPIETAVAADPLRVRLLQCQQAGEAAGSDAACLSAWAENRRRFLGLGRARPAEPDPVSNAADGDRRTVGPSSAEH